MGRRRSTLPGALTEVAFPVSRAAKIGIGYQRLRGADLQRPFHGVRANGVDLAVPRQLCRALAEVFQKWHAFSHRTAAELWGLPLPDPNTPVNRLDVLSLRGRDAMRRKGVSGRSTVLDLPVRRTLGVAVIAPADVWCQLAAPELAEFTREWLVAIGDFLVSGERTDFGRKVPLCTREELAAAVIRHGSKPGIRDLKWALERVRTPVDSVRETFLRLALVQAGLPEPAVQVPVMTADGMRHADLGYPEAGLLLEYLGDAHRTSRRRWLDDLRRVQLFQDAGWDVMLVGGADLEPDPGPLVARVRRALATRHPHS